MPFCPQCRSEYRPGFTTCNTCGGVALVEALPELRDMGPEDLPNSLPVGFTPGGGAQVEVDGQLVDSSKIFVLSKATEIRDTLAESGVSALIVPFDEVQFPDNVTRFEVRVHKDTHAQAE